MAWQTWLDGDGTWRIDSGSTAGCETDQRKWDSWLTMWQPVKGVAPSVHTPGNHEIDLQSGIEQHATDSPATSYGTTRGNGLNVPFQASASRLPSGSAPFSAIGDIWSTLFFSHDIGPVHLIVLSSFAAFGSTTAQARRLRALPSLAAAEPPPPKPCAVRVGCFGPRAGQPHAHALVGRQHARAAIHDRFNVL